MYIVAVCIDQLGSYSSWAV